MTTRRIFYICNAFDDSVKANRRITTDSPAASRKVYSLCRAARAAGGEVSILSLGRGGSKKTFDRFAGVASKRGAVPAVYLPFWDVPVVSHLVTALALAATVARLSRRDSVLIFYNYHPHYVGALFLGRLLGMRCILDVEDGYVPGQGLRGRLGWLTLKIHKSLCRDGTMLASVGLRDETSLAPFYVCYGVAEPTRVFRNWSEPRLRVLFGGSLFEDTGAGLFLDAVSLLRNEHPEALQRLAFDVSGFGPYAAIIEQASRGPLAGVIHFWGSVTGAKYRELLRAAHVGLCLKLPSSGIGRTTFPSKVVEFASQGLLVVSTRVSDVPALFDDESAVLLAHPTPLALASAFREIVAQPERASDRAHAGQERLSSQLAPSRIGAELLRFWAGEPGAAARGGERNA
jgi:glycosyltransferase involved in cell wall biosynthesis